MLNNYLSGDRSAISELIERHSVRVRHYIGVMVKDDAVADDIFQETFIKAVKVIDEVQIITPFVQVGTYPTRNFATLGPL